MKNEVELFLIFAYAPIGNANQKLWDTFIEKLQICISRKHPNDIIVIGCDNKSNIGISYKRSNHVSKRSIGPFGLTHRNRASACFNTYLEVNNLVVVTTYYKKIIIQPGLIQDQNYFIKLITLLLKKMTFADS